MADAGVVRDGSRLPWLEPYRAPPRRASNRRAGVTAVLGMIGLAGVIALLARDMIPLPAAAPVASAPVETMLPAPAELQPAIVLPQLKTAAEPNAREAPAAAPPRARSAPPPRRRINTTPTYAAYRQVLRGQSADEASQLATAQAAAAIADLPAPPEPPRPAVDPSAEIVRGKTVQLGVFRSHQAAEFAWRSAIRDYTYLVTMPKSIQQVSIRSRRFYRLQLGTPSKKHAKQLCSNLKSIGRSCTVA